ncbi:MAG: AAA family ATPase [Planctomycetia bacterium]|nr:AAA family ATPase [Planctomycetia bacterium]
MNIQKVEITNFRGIHEMSLDIHPNMNVLVGENGAGKSSLLDALAIILSRVVSMIRTGKNTGRNISSLDISASQTFSQIQLTFEDITNRKPYTITISKFLPGTKKAQKTENIPSECRPVHDFMSQFREKIKKTEENCSIPVIIYYQASRVALNFPKFIRTDTDFSLLSIYRDALACKADYKILLEWMRERESLEDKEFRRIMRHNEELIRQNKDLSKIDLSRLQRDYRDKQLETVRYTWKQFMPELSNFSIEMNPLRLQAEKNGVTFSINQLSDGEKSLLAMVGDIARRLSIANPTLDNPLLGDGIIMIDEIDLHLHPARQRTIITKLQEVFPNCQFIVATHSPQILGHVHPENIILFYMDEQGTVQTRRPEESYGMTSNEILEDLMEVPSRNSEEEGKLLRLFELIERRRLSEAKALIEEIRQYRRSEPKLITADARIRRLEMNKE